MANHEKQWYVKLHRYSATWDGNQRRFKPDRFVGVTANLGPFGSEELALRAEHIMLACMHPNRNRPIVEHSSMMKYRMDNTNPDPLYCNVTHVYSTGIGVY